MSKKKKKKKITMEDLIYTKTTKKRFISGKKELNEWLTGITDKQTTNNILESIK